MTRRRIALVALLIPVLLHAGAACAQATRMAMQPASDRLDNASLIDATYLIEFSQGSRLSDRALGLGNGGFETATGNRVDFSNWYASRWTDVSIAWLTQVTPNFGIIHGFSTGERGSKYTIDPSLKLGILAQVQTRRRAFLSLRATTTLGGQLREKPCAADYGDIGGVQTVNCRLAATPLPPAQTLDYLVKEKPFNRNQATLMFHWQF